MSTATLDRSMVEYLSNLELRDEREEAPRRIADDFSRVVDRTNKAEAKLRVIEISGGTVGDSPSTDVLSHLRSELASTRSDLTTVQGERTTLTAQNADLQTKLANLQRDTASAKQEAEFFQKQATAFERKMKDRHSETRQSRKFHDDLQNEILTLTMERNLAEEERDKLRKDNEMLVERWMREKRVEADRMNDQSQW